MKSGHAYLGGHLGTCNILSASIEKNSSSTGGRSSYRRCSVRKGVLRNFAKSTGNHLCQSLFFNKFAVLKPGR